MDTPFNIPEELLHYAWKTLSFDLQNIQTSKGEVINIIYQGNHNLHDGPDFLEAKVKINDVIWAGAIEIHIKSSDWIKHNHQTDDMYKNVILHVVWENNKEIKGNSGNYIPVFEIKNHINPDLIKSYFKIKSSNAEIPCQENFKTVSDISKFATLDKVLVERLIEKSAFFTSLVNQSNTEDATYKLLVKALGMKYNQDVFLELTNLLPLKLLQKHSDNLLQLEALLFGVANMIETNSNDNYMQLLTREFSFLQHKYQLKQLPKNQWKYLGLRPANFPTIRLAQLAYIIHKTNLLYSFLTESDYKQIYKLFKTVETSVYWQTHYVFEKESGKKIKKLGIQTIHSILINVAVPVLTYRSQLEDNTLYLDKAEAILGKISAENNSIISIYKDLNFAPENAFYSQALIGLYKNYCSTKKCLNCGIFNEIIKNKTPLIS